jgi:Pentatricopeptide repeat domain
MTLLVAMIPPHPTTASSSALLVGVAGADAFQQTAAAPRLRRRFVMVSSSRNVINCKRISTRTNLRLSLDSSTHHDDDESSSSSSSSSSGENSYNRRHQQQQSRRPAHRTAFSSLSKSSSSSSSHHYPRDRKTQRQLEWILYTVNKTQYQQQEQHDTETLLGGGAAAAAASNHDDAISLVQALQRLVFAKTSLQVSEAGRLLHDATNLLWEHHHYQKRNATTALLSASSITNSSWAGAAALSFWDIQERLVKATSLTGLVHLSFNITNRMLQAGHLPSTMTQDAICNSLRRAGRLECLQEVMLQLGALSLSTQQQQQQQQMPDITSATTTTSVNRRGVSLSAFNSYLAAMCDIVMDHRKENWQLLVSQPSTFRNDQNSRGALLEKCWQWIRSSGGNTTSNHGSVPSCVAQLGVEPDAVSFATVLQAAASIGNETLTNLLWNEMMHRRCIQPNIVAYNARLRMAGKSSLQTQSERDANILTIWQDEIEQDVHVQPDRYTIDLLLLPLTRQGQIGQVQELLDDFVLTNNDSGEGNNSSSVAQRRRQQTLVSAAFCAFFQTLVQGGEVSMAQDLFDNYLLPALSTGPIAAQNDKQKRSLVVRPTTRHFNVLLDGYRRLLQQQHVLQHQEEESCKANDHDSTSTRAIESSKDTNVQKCSYESGWALFRLMLNHTSRQVRPDEFTFTSMMGLCTTPGELSDLLKMAVDQYGIECSSAVLRAAITTFGELGDASSACWLFAQFACPIRLAPPTSFSYRYQSHCQPAPLREWNVLLGALAHAAGQNATYRLDVEGAQVAATMSNVVEPTNGSYSTLATNHPLSVLTTGNTCSVAACLMLDAMTKESSENDIAGISFQLPKPNSQSYCLVATALQHDFGPTAATERATKVNEALQLFRRAMSDGTPADGRFLNAIFRCFGCDINAALAAWKTEIRPACVAHENRRRSRPPPVHRKQGKNLVAAYHGLLYCSGRAQRADIALRIVYAMTKEGLEPSETALNVYQAGKRRQNEIMEHQGISVKMSSLLAQKLSLVDPYESLLYVECTKYNRADQRRAGEKRVRIIV